MREQRNGHYRAVLDRFQRLPTEQQEQLWQQAIKSEASESLGNHLRRKQRERFASPPHAVLNALTSEL
jgi:hypothetical protein